MAKSRSIIIINPNSTAAMTSGLIPLVNALCLVDTDIAYFTAPSGPRSINDEDDASESSKHCLPHLRPLLENHDAFLIACYSQHPLVAQLKQEPAILQSGKPITGIFEASVGASLQLIAPGEKFGIISTGKVWENLLTNAVVDFLGINVQTQYGSNRFAGVETTGLTATELHEAPAEYVRMCMKDATRRLVSNDDVGAICLGCAGMAGMNETVRKACVEILGPERGAGVRIVDGVQAGVIWLEGCLRSQF